MKKVLFVIDTLEVGGAEQSILEIASRFRSYTPVLCHLYAGESLRPAYEQKGIEVFSCNTPGHYNFREASARLRSVVHKISPVIVHSTLFRSDWVSRNVIPSLNIPLVNSLVNDSYSAERYLKLSLTGKMKLKAVELMDRMSAHRVGWFISNSEAIRRSNARKLKIDPEKITVIYRGRDLTKFNTDPVLSSLREELNLPADSVIMINVSRLLERKGQADLIDAFKSMAARSEKSILVLVGEGPHRPVLERMILESGLKDKVFLLGTRRDVPSLLAQSDIFVFPSHFEGLPGALIEAMMAKKIIVASSIPENLECIDASSAYLFPTGNTHELADRLLQALTDNGRSEKPEHAYAQAVAKFEIGAIASQYERYYDTITGR